MNRRYVIKAIEGFNNLLGEFESDWLPKNEFTFTDYENDLAKELDNVRDALEKFKIILEN